MMITLYIYNKSDGMFLYSDIGSIDNVIDDLQDTQDFTLTPIPDDTKQFRWCDNEWQEID